jgi:hypothetical protein
LSGSASVTAPIPISPSVSVSAGRETTNGQTLEFDEAVAQPLVPANVPPNVTKPVRPSDFGEVRSSHGELYGALMIFRSAILAAAANRPCFKNPTEASADTKDAKKPPANTIALAFTVVNTGGGSVGIKLASTAGFSFAGSSKTTAGNTITVTFAVLSSSGMYFTGQ